MFFKISRNPGSFTIIVVLCWWNLRLLCSSWCSWKWSILCWGHLGSSSFGERTSRSRIRWISMAVCNDGNLMFMIYHVFVGPLRWMPDWCIQISFISSQRGSSSNLIWRWSKNTSFTSSNGSICQIIFKFYF